MFGWGEDFLGSDFGRVKLGRGTRINTDRFPKLPILL